MIEVFIITILILILILMPRSKNVYQVAYELGNNYLNNINLSQNYAVMFDIDDTLINNHNKPIKPIIKLMKECNKKNILVLIITARDSIYTKETIQTLMEHGIYPNPTNPEFIEIYNYLKIIKEN